MRAILDHVGVAVADLDAALAFYRDALGLEIEGSEEVASQRVRAHFLPVGAPRLELLEATAGDSPIARFLGRRGPGLHHITLRVDDIAAAVAHLKARGARLIDEQPRPGAEGALVAFIHPSSAHGVLVELKQEGRSASGVNLEVSRHALGDLELIAVSDGSFRIDGGALFGIVPKALWSRRFAPDDDNRVELALRQLVVRGVRTMLVDAGLGDKADEAYRDRFAVDRSRHLDHALAAAGLNPESIDVVLLTHLHRGHAGGCTVRDAQGRLRPRFPRARYVARRGDWEEAVRPDARTTASYAPDDFVPLQQAGVLELVDDDQTIMPGVKVQRTGGHTRHHQIVLVESNGQHAVFAGDLVPTAAHLAPDWTAAIDQHPAETAAAKQAFAAEAAAHRTIIFFSHDPHAPAARLVEADGGPALEPL